MLHPRFFFPKGIELVGGEDKVLGIIANASTDGVGVDIKGKLHFGGIFGLNGAGKGAILGDFATAVMFFIEVDTVARVMSSEEIAQLTGTVWFGSEGIDFMGMIGHEAEGIERAGLFGDFLVEIPDIGLFFHWGLKIVLFVVPSPGLMQAKTGDQEVFSGNAWHMAQFDSKSHAKTDS